MRSMVVALLALVLTPASFAQKTEADVRARLVDKPLYLRGQWTADKLAFDASGRLQGKSATVSFTLSGIAIDQVQLARNGLTLNGQRVALEFVQDGPQRVGLLERNLPGSLSRAEQVILHIQRPRDGDYTAALDAIFTHTLADLVPQMPDYWQPYASQHLLPAGSDAPRAADDSGAETFRPGADGVSAPKLVTRVDPEYSEAARVLRYSGVVLLRFRVGANGVPSQVRILRPVGLGLDERAVAAVSQYRFQPAMRGGSPVAVDLNVEVSFHIF
jgi:TonB family protein